MTTPREQLKDLMLDHRISTSTGGCLCGEVVPRFKNPHAQARHLADAIIQAGWRPPKAKKPKPPHDPRVISIEETEKFRKDDWGWD